MLRTITVTGLVASAVSFTPSAPSMGLRHGIKVNSFHTSCDPRTRRFVTVALFSLIMEVNSCNHYTRLHQTQWKCLLWVAFLPVVGISCAMYGTYMGSADTRYDTISPSSIIEEDNTSNGKFSLTAARGMILLAAVLCGTNFGAVKLLQDTMDPPLLLSVRFFICAMCMSPLLHNLNPKILAPALQTGTLLGLGYLTQAIALQTTSAGVIAFLCSLTTVTCPFIEKLSGGRVGTQGWAACGLAVLGAALLELGGGSAPGVGDVWGLLQPVMFGLFFWKTEQAMREFPEQALPFTTVQVFVCALLGAAWSVLDAGGMPDLGPLLSLTSDLSYDLSLLWLGLVSTAGVLVLQTLALGTMPSSETAVVFSSEPLWGVAFANMLLGESIGSNTVVGGSLIIAACIVRVLKFDADSLAAMDNMFQSFVGESEMD